MRILCLWLGFAGCAAPLAAVEVKAVPDVEPLYRVTRWTTDHGLPQNRISCLQQTHDGYLWIGTWFGLARFDGVRFTVFDKANTRELVNDAINALAEDTDGTLWIATADGLLSYREHQFHRLTVTDGLPDQKVWRLAACRSGGIWLQAGDVVTRLQNGIFAHAWNMPVSYDNNLHSLREGADGWLHITMDAGWLALSPKADELRTNHVVEPATSSWLAGLPAKLDDILWVGTRQGLQRVQPANAQMVGTNELGPRAVDFIYEDRSSNLWVNAQPGGLYHWDQKHWRPVDLAERLVPSSAICMEEDREGNIWVGTDGGLVQLQTRRVRAYTTRDGLADDQVWSVCEGTDGTIWLGANRGLNRIQNGRVPPLEVADIYADHADRCVWPARDGGVWIAKSRIGVYEFREELTQRIPASALPNENIGALYGDRAGRLWIGTGNGLAVCTKGQVTTAYTHWAGRSGYDVRCILEDRTGTFWFGTQGQGLTRMRDEKFDVFTTRDGLSSDRVWAIHEDADGVLWLGTEDGLTRYQHGRFFAFTRRHGLLENAINWILEDDFGYLWLSGLRGIYRVKREQLNAVAKSRARVVECSAFGTADGMESSETNGEGQPAGWKARDGRLWFPTTRGVVVIDPKTIQVSEVPPPVVIEQVKADDEVIFGDGVTRSNPKSEIRNPKFNLPPGRAQVVEISYTANTFADAKRARFRYRMVGRDSGWRDETSERVAHYTNLRPGNYRFEVTAANQHGVWNPVPVSFAFSLAPHVYETWTFYLAGGAMVLFAGLAFHFRRIHGFRRFQRLEQQRALQEERSRIARDLHDDLGASLTGLALQLEAARTRGHAEGRQLADLASDARGIAQSLRELSWATNPRCDNLGSLGVFLGELVERFGAAAQLECRLELPPVEKDLPIPARARHDLLVLVKEGLANIAKHARARRVTLQLSEANGTLRLRVSDDGTGFDATKAFAGSGLRNLRERLENAGGSFEIWSYPDQGTKITATLPLRVPRES